MTEAPLAKEPVGKNPTDRGKNGDKTQCSRRRPWAADSRCSRGANAHDVSLLEETLDNMVVCRPGRTEGRPQNLCLDAGYIAYDEKVGKRGYIPHIRPRGEEKQLIERNPGFKARHWVVEATHSFANRFRKILVRFEKKSSNYLGLLEFAFAIIVWRNLIPIHKGVVIIG